MWILSMTSDTCVCNATHENLLLAISQLERIDLFVYRQVGEKKRKRFQSASSWRESAGRTESLSERMGKKRVWTARAFQFLGNRRPISARAKSTPARRRRSAASTLLALDRRNRCCAGSRDFAPSSLPPPRLFRCRIFLHACRIPLVRSRFRSFPTLRLSVLSTPGGAMEGLCTRSRRKTASDDCGLRPRKTIAVGRRNSDFEFIKE